MGMDDNKSDEDYLDQLLSSVTEAEAGLDLDAELASMDLSDELNKLNILDDLSQDSTDDNLGSLDTESLDVAYDSDDSDEFDEFGDISLDDLLLDTEDSLAEADELDALLGADFDDLEAPVLSSTEPVQRPEPEAVEEEPDELDDLLNSLAGLGDDSEAESVSSEEGMTESSQESEISEAESQASEVDAFMSDDLSALLDEIPEKVSEAEPEAASENGAEASEETAPEAQNQGNEMAELLEGLDDIPDISEISEKNEDGKKSKKEKKSKKKKKGEASEEGQESEEKVGFFAKLFGKKKKTEEEGEASESAPAKDENQQLIETMDEWNPETNPDLAGLEDRSADKKDKKEKKKKEKKEKPKKEKKKKEKKEKKPKEKKEKVPSNEPKIHIPIPVYILMITVAVGVTVLLKFGGTSYHYKSNVKDAVDLFVHKNYEESYHKMSGMTLKKSDEAFYKQVETLMYVEHQYNAYESYRYCEDYSHGLHSLLKGIERYDRHKDEAAKYGVSEEMEGIYQKILEKLSYDYNLSEARARQLMGNDDSYSYSENIEEIAKKYAVRIESNKAQEKKDAELAAEEAKNKEEESESASETTMTKNDATEE